MREKEGFRRAGARFKQMFTDSSFFSAFPGHYSDFCFISAAAHFLFLLFVSRRDSPNMSSLFLVGIVNSQHCRGFLTHKETSINTSVCS